MPYINAHGIPQYYRSQGSGPPIVFVHGALVDHRSWDPQLEAFKETHHVLTYDLRGHGRTGPSDRADYSIALFAEDLRALLDALSIERPLLCGLSLGGMIAQAYAARFPVAGLVLADTLVGIRAGRRDDLIRYLLYPRWLMALATRWLNPDQFGRAALWMARLTQGSGWLERERRAYVRACLRLMRAREVRKTLDAIYRFEPQPLERVERPALILNGEREAGIVRRHSEIILGRLSNARAEQIPRAGHLSNLDNPTEFNQRLGRFLAQAAA